MIVHNPQNQINEAYRVLRPGSAACFTIWANEDDWFTCVEKAVQKVAPDQFSAGKGDFYHLYRDKGVRVKEMLRKVGFTNIKLWEQPINFLFRNGLDFMNKFGDGNLHEMAKTKNLN